MASRNGHSYHSDDGRCVSCGVDERGGVNVLCDTLFDDNVALDSEGEGSKQRRTVIIADGVGVSRPSVHSAPTGVASFEDTPDYDDYCEEVDMVPVEEGDGW